MIITPASFDTVNGHCGKEKVKAVGQRRNRTAYFEIVNTIALIIGLIVKSPQPGAGERRSGDDAKAVVYADQAKDQALSPSSMDSSWRASLGMASEHSQVLLLPYCLVCAPPSGQRPTDFNVIESFRRSFSASSI